MSRENVCKTCGEESASSLGAASHTPGPWIRVPQTQGAGDMIAHPFETGNQMSPQGLRIVAFMMARRDSINEDKANAALVEAAPDLLEALKLSVDKDGCACNERDDGHHPYVCYKHLAIAKAEGE